jgi:RND family efflux transporter MFP subunit
MKRFEESIETDLREEIAELKRQLEEHQRPRPSRGRMIFWAVLSVVLLVAGFVGGYLPRQRRAAILATEAHEGSVALPVVNVTEVKRTASGGELLLPATLQAITEAPVMARTEGYLRRRFADIGDRVTAGQVLGELEAPELQQQIRQAAAAVEQARAAAEQASAALDQGSANAELARVTATRWANLSARGVVSRQENDQYQAQFRSQSANVAALTKAVSAARSNVNAVEANLARLRDVEGYQKVRAPFDGVITVRNVDVGALISSGSTLLFRVAQTGMLRAYVNVPQSAATAVKPGQKARITVPDLPGKAFDGTITRSASALDPASRTLLTEVQIPNPGGLLLPGMYVQAGLIGTRGAPALLIPGDTVMVRADGPQVGAVGQDGVVHLTRISVGRDYGDRVEVASGLQEGQWVVMNPGDTVREGARVKAVRVQEKPKAR